MAHALAVMRQLANRGQGVTNLQMARQDPIQIERDGVLAEMAFGKAYNLWPDLSVAPRHGGPDLIGRNGWRIDVKATRRANGRLLVPTYKPAGDVDIYVLAIVTDTEVDLIGYIDAAQAQHPDNLQDLGYGPTYVIAPERLTPLRPRKDGSGDV